MNVLLLDGTLRFERGKSRGGKEVCFIFTTVVTSLYTTVHPRLYTFLIHSTLSPSDPTTFRARSKMSDGIGIAK